MAQSATRRGALKKFGLGLAGIALASLGLPNMSAAPITTIPVTDANWFFSPYNWHVQGTEFAESTRPGAYFKIGFTGANIALGVDVAPLAPSPSSLLPLLRWQIDDLPMQEHQLQHNDKVIALHSKRLSLGAHSLSVWFVTSDRFANRWTPPLVSVVRVTGLIADPGATTFPLALKPARMIFFGECGTEGMNTEGTTGNIINNCDATHAYPYACAAGLNAEFGVVGQAGQGWTMGGQAGTPLLPAAWQWQFEGVPRIFSPEPDYLVAMAGGFDYIFGGPVAPALVTSTITDWIAQVRAVLPDTKVFVAVEFSGFYRDAIMQAVTDYQRANRWDKNTYLLDLGAAGQEGLLTYFDYHGTLYSYDGWHPTAARAAVLGQMVAQAIQTALSK